MKSLPRLRALVSGLTGVSVRAAGLASSVAQAQQGCEAQERRHPQRRPVRSACWAAAPDGRP